jgi:hypothetical protein
VRTILDFPQLREQGRSKTRKITETLVKCQNTLKKVVFFDISDPFFECGGLMPLYHRTGLDLYQSGVKPPLSKEALSPQGPI